MSKIETIGNATLYLGDCREILPTLGKVDAVVTDPPYGVTQNAWDQPLPMDVFWGLIDAACSGTVVLTARQPFAAALVNSRKDRFRHEWIWEKNKASGHLNAKSSPLLAHETILVFSERPPFYVPQFSTGHEPANSAVRKTATSRNYGAQRPTNYGGATIRYPRTVQRFDIINNNDPDKKHPTQKPVELFSYFLRTYSAVDALILDHFMGSGTTGVAAIKTQRRFIGIERDPQYFDIACQRIDNAVRTPELFGEPTQPQPGWDEMWSKPLTDSNPEYTETE